MPKVYSWYNIAMNKVVTKTILYRGTEISVDNLKENSQLKVIVECSHGQREVRWCRRHQLCRKCVAETGLYNTSKPGRVITWGDKISKSKKGVLATEEHKKALIKTRKIKFCQRVGINLDEFKQFPSYSEGRFNVSYALRLGIIHNWNNVPLSDNFINIFNELGYSLLDLKQRIESTFEDNMTWDNYGYEVWHVDHIRPLSWFNIQELNDEEFKKCWSLSNLQAKWAKDNLKKNNLFEG